MIAAGLLAVAVAALPQGGARYRAELGGVAVGFVELRIACGPRACTARYGAWLRLPAEAGGGVQETRVDVELDRDGRWGGGPLAADRGGALAAGAGVRGAVPASMLEVVLAAAPPGDGTRCASFFDEHDGSSATACARREGERITVQAGGVREEIVPGADGFPAEVIVEGRFRYVRDPRATVPERAPRVAGTRVAGPAAAAAVRFCGVPRDPIPGPAGDLPAPRAPGDSCREKTAAYLAAARERGIAGRTAVGVAWDGAGFVWHAWAELRRGGAWVPVDPSFEELPARGPRFTLARYADGDARARSEAGARILACWGRARVEGL